METKKTIAESSSNIKGEPNRNQVLKDLQKKVGIRFNNIELLDQAFTHRSYTNEKKENIKDNERLEFLGDSVLGLIVAKFLYSQNEKVPEGVLSKWKSKLVSGPMLADICKSLGLINYLQLGEGERESGKENVRLMENLLEAFLGALYLDKGFHECESFLLPFIKKAFKSIDSIESIKDYKSLLQEKSQKFFKKIPRYELVQESGLDHDKVFIMRVILPNGMTAIGSGKNKKTAQQNAAKSALQLWNSNKK